MYLLTKWRSLLCIFEVAVSIGRYRGGAEGAMAPLISYKYFQNVVPLTVWVCFENHFIKCCLTPYCEMSMLPYFALRIHSQCCMLHVPKSKGFHSGGGGRGEGEEGGGLGPLFLNFLYLPLPVRRTSKKRFQVHMTRNFEPLLNGLVLIKIIY